MEGGEGHTTVYVSAFVFECAANAILTAYLLRHTAHLLLLSPFPTHVLTPTPYTYHRMPPTPSCPSTPSHYSSSADSSSALSQSRPGGSGERGRDGQLHTSIDPALAKVVRGG